LGGERGASSAFLSSLHHVVIPHYLATMVQLFNSQTSYPSTSIVAYHNGLYQTLSFSSPASVRPASSPPPPSPLLPSSFCKLSFADLAFSSAFTFLQAPLSSPWTYLGTDIYGVPTPHAQLLGATSQATARIFDEAEELSLAAEDAFNIREDSLEDWEHLSSPSSRPVITNAPEPPPKDSSSSSPSYAPPPPPHDCSLAEREAHLQFSAHILKAELVGEFVFKTNSRGCFAFDGESARVGSEEEMMEKLREASFRDVLGDDKFGGEDSEKRAAWLDGALARKEYYSLPGAESPDCV